MARKPPPARRKPALEWIAAGLGLILTLGVLGLVGRDALTPATPPDIALRAVAVRSVAAGFQVEVEAANRGRRTAAGVEIEGVLNPATGPEETATASLDYAPGLGTETLTLQFRADPRAGDLALTVRGWSEP